LYIGTAKNLKNRIEGHWDTKNTNVARGALNSFKELFDLELDPALFYPDIELWNQHWGDLKKSERKTSTLFDSINQKGNNTLIWFPDPLFFQTYLKNLTTNINPASNWHNNTITPCSLHFGTLNTKIRNVKEVITSKFYYSYAEIEDKILLTTIEANVNSKLRTNLKLPTYAKSSNSFVNIGIDLSSIQEVLVIMTGKPFNSPLIIP
jgi:hypothetical protein